MAEMWLRRQILHTGLCTLLLALHGTAAQAQAAPTKTADKPADSGAKDATKALARVPVWPAKFVIVLGCSLACLSYLILILQNFQHALRGELPVKSSSQH